MNNDIAIKVENLSKIYKLYNAPIDRLKESLHWRGKKYHKDFYALNDVSFEIKKGETVGIIGKNGSGKSTLLKIITGVLTPSNGKVTVNGRVSALLELGAGFNPEYTGLENIYFQGNLMGYSQEEVETKIKEILDFADIGDFIHQPVKVYSSGMFARLAFAVAINVEPDILIVDEALSVGDMAFQNKCLRHMEHIVESGVTILFVTHDIQAINKFCNQALWINEGRICEFGDTAGVTKKYSAFAAYGAQVIKRADNNITKEIPGNNYTNIKFNKILGESHFGSMHAQIISAGFYDCNFNEVVHLKQNDKVKFIALIRADVDTHSVAVGFTLKDKLNNAIFTINSYMYDCAMDILRANTQMIVEFEFIVPKLYPTTYNVDVALAEGTQSNHIQNHWIHSATKVDIMSNDFIEQCIYTLPKESVKISYIDY